MLSGNTNQLAGVVTRQDTSEIPDSKNRIYIGAMAGKFFWRGVVDLPDYIIHSSSGAKFTSFTRAEADALAWAREYGVTNCLMETGKATTAGLNRDPPLALLRRTQTVRHSEC